VGSCPNSEVSRTYFKLVIPQELPHWAKHLVNRLRYFRNQQSHVRHVARDQRVDSQCPQAVDAWGLSATRYHLHQVCEQVNSDSGGNATISIYPSLRDSPADLSVITLFNCVGLFRLKNNTRAWHSDFTQLTQLSFDAVEVR